MKEAFYKMSERELNKLEVMQKITMHGLQISQASALLGLSNRQILRILKTYKANGPRGLISKRRGKASNNRHSDYFKKQVLDFILLNYRDFGPTLASEKLFERHQLKVNKETCRQWMMEAGIWEPKRRKSAKLHQQRARRSCFGELIQIDGSPHAWFEKRGPKCCLLVFIDDASGRLTELLFVKAETTLAYFKAVRNHMARYGRPLCFYSDKHGIFKVNHKEAKSGTGETQFGRAMRELGIETICANTPQAKGRVERINGILQDRLVKELRLRNISDMETANAFLPSFMKDYNKRFAVEAMSSIDAHRKGLPSTKVLNLIFSKQATRMLSKNLELSYENRIYQIQTKGQGYGLRRAKVTVYDDWQGNITLVRKGQVLKYSVFKKATRSPARIVSSKELTTLELYKMDGRNKGFKPKEDHPWRNSYSMEKRQRAARV